MISVPVLSELIADVDPSVSTDERSLTMAWHLARSIAPMDRITWDTVDSASGIAAMARAMAVTNSASHAWPRDAPSANITIMVTPAAAPIHRVIRLSCWVSGACSTFVAESMPAILPTSVAAPVPVTIITPLPCVTGVFMKAMSDWSPAARSTTSPATTPSAGISDSAPSRRTRAVAFIIDLSAFIALSALPSSRRPTTALITVSTSTMTPVWNWPMTIENVSAASRMICM